MENTKKPGVMVYFEMRPLLDRLSVQDTGLLFRAMLEYGETGEVPQLSKNLRLCWPLIQMRLDNDDQRYQNVISQRKYAAYCRREKRQNNTPLGYHEWLELQGSGENGLMFS